MEGTPSFHLIYLNIHICTSQNQTKNTLYVTFVFFAVSDTGAHRYFSNILHHKARSRLSLMIRRVGSRAHIFFLSFRNSLHIYQAFGYKSKWNQNSYWLLYSLNYNGNWTKKNISGCQCRTNGWAEHWQFKQSHSGCREGLCSAGSEEQQQFPAFLRCSIPSPAHP